MRRTIVTLAALVGLALSACVPLAGRDPQDIIALMQQQNARGCIYARVAVQFAGQGSLILVGTWGPDPPEYQACWQKLPGGLP